jgi:hypothetical protein
MLQHGNRARQRLCGGRILVAFLLVLNLGRTSLARGRDQDVALQIPPVKTTLKVDDQPVAITASGAITQISRQRDQVAFRLDLSADLSDFQRNITQILRSQLNKSDRCGEHIDIQNATIVPAEPASLVTAQLHYERWGCAKIFGKQNVRRLVGGNVVVELKLTPQVEESRTVRLQGELGAIQADGSLGELLRTGPFEQMLRDKVAHSLESATEKGTDFSETLPPAAQGFATIQGAQFKGDRNGHLYVVLGGEIHITSAQAELLKSQLRERALRTR